MAAVLAGGDGAVLSHASALPVWGIRPVRGSGPVHVTIPGSGRGRRPGIRFHRAIRLADDERTVVNAIPITSPGRTLADVAGMVGRREIELTLAVAEREGLIRSDELSVLPERYRGWRGMSILKTPAPGRARVHALRGRTSVAGDAADGRASAAPRERRAGTLRARLLLALESVAVEVDGRAHHSSRPQLRGRPTQGRLAPRPRRPGDPADVAADHAERNVDCRRRRAGPRAGASSPSGNVDTGTRRDPTRRDPTRRGPARRG